MDPNNSENSNPYDDANYSNPSFPKNPNINSGTPNPYSQNNGQNQNPYNQNPYGQYPANPNNRQTNGNDKRPATGMEIASLILGVLSITCCGSVIFAIIGLILLAVSKSKTKDYSGVGIGGLICCIIGLVIGIVFIAIIIGSGLLASYLDDGNIRDFLLIYLS